jgi:hypothetical protein
MGKLLSLLARDNSGDCCGPKSNYDIFLDFENAQPTEDEFAVYEEVNRVLEKSDQILQEIQVYKVSHIAPHLNNIWKMKSTKSLFS